MKYLYFSAPWCGPCKMLGPIMEKVKTQGIPVEKINVDTETNLVTQYSVRNIPTVVLVDSTGKEFARTVGVKSENHFVEQYKNFTNA